MPSGASQGLVQLAPLPFICRIHLQLATGPVVMLHAVALPRKLSGSFVRLIYFLTLYLSMCVFFNHALADVRLTDAGIECRYCKSIALLSRYSPMFQTMPGVVNGLKRKWVKQHVETVLFLVVPHLHHNVHGISESKCG